MSTSNTTFVPIAIYIPIAIPVSSTLSSSEIETIMNNSLTSMNAKTFNFQTENTINVQTSLFSLSSSLSQSISKINEENFSIIENMNNHLHQSTSPTLSSFDCETPITIIDPVALAPTVESIVEEPAGDYLYRPQEVKSISNQEMTSEWISCSDLEMEDQTRERPIIQSTLDISFAESKTTSSSDLIAQSLVCRNNVFSDSVFRDINNKSAYYFNMSLVQPWQTSANLPALSSTLFSSPLSTTTTTTTTTQTQYCTQTTCNQSCLNWDNPQNNQNNQQQCCVFSNESNEVFFPVSPRSCPPSPSSPMPMSSPSSSSPMRFSSSSLLLLTLCSILLRNLFVSSALLSLRISSDLQALHYCLFKSNFKSGFSFSDQKFSENNEERREREERGEEEGKEGKGGKGGIIIIDDAANDDAADAYDYAADYYYADHHDVHDVVHDVVVVSPLVAPIATLAIRAIA